MFGCLLACLVGWLVGWLVGFVLLCFVLFCFFLCVCSFFVCLFVCLFGWLVGLFCFCFVRFCLFVRLFVSVMLLRYMHCTHTTAHSNDTVKHTHCLAQAGLKDLAQVTDKKAD